MATECSGSGRSHHRQSAPRRLLQLLARYDVTALSVLALLAAGLGYFGFREYYGTTPPQRNWLDFVYLTLQLFILESGSSALGSKPWTLEVARLLAPLVAASAAVRALLALAQERLQAVRLWFAEEHVIVCGLGAMGARLVEQFRTQGRDVVVIDKRADHPELKRCRDLGAIVLAGDAAMHDVLARARVWRAHSLYALTHVDLSDLDIALAAYEVVSEKGGLRPGCSLRCGVHVVDARLSDELKHHCSFSEPPPRVEIWPFNVHALAARCHFAKHPLDPSGDAAGSPRGAHLMVVGCDRTGEAFALQGARIGHFAGGRPLRITVFDRVSGLRRRQLEARFPGLQHAAAWTFEEVDVDTVDFHQALHAALGAADEELTVVVCLESQEHGLACAAVLAERLTGRRATIGVTVWGEGKLGTLMAAQDAPGRPRVSTISIADLTCQTDVVEGDSVDALAMAFHQAFLAEQGAAGRLSADNPAHRTWASLPEAFRESNRQEADHLSVKLRAIACTLGDLAGDSAPATGGRVTAFTPQEIETLAAMEHARWCSERFLAGWQHGPEKDVARKIHPLLQPWSAIPDEARVYNRSAVAKLPKVLGKLRRSIARVA